MKESFNHLRNVLIHMIRSESKPLCWIDTFVHWFQMFNLEIEFNQTCRAIKLYIYLFPKATHPNKKDKNTKKNILLFVASLNLTTWDKRRKYWKRISDDPSRNKQIILNIYRIKWHWMHYIFSIHDGGSTT